jgi:Zn-finger nucleic acid-binding protein
MQCPKCKVGLVMSDRQVVRSTTVRSVAESGFDRGEPDMILIGVGVAFGS